MNKNLLETIGVWGALLLTLTINYLSNALPINGQNASQISAKFSTFFTPAGFAFSIWGIIYLGFIGFAIYQSLPAQRADARVVAARPWVIFNGLLNSAWLPLFHFEQMGIALLVMFALLFSLLKIHEALQTGRTKAKSWTETLLARVPFSIYLGWICVASIANASIFLDTTTWSGWGISGPVWAVVMITVGTTVAIIFYWTFLDVAFLLVFAWAFWAIYNKQQGVPLVPETALVAINVVAVVLVVAQWLKRKKQAILSPKTSQSAQ